MCRKYVVKFDNCPHGDANLDKTFPCRDHTHCQTTVEVEHIEEFRCSRCFRTVPVIRGAMEEYYPEGVSDDMTFATDSDIAAVRALMHNLAAPPGSHTRVWQVPVKYQAEFGPTYTYNSENLDEFCDSLLFTSAVTIWVNRVNNAFWTYIIQSDTPQLTENEFQLYRQFQKLRTSHFMTIEEDRKREDGVWATTGLDLRTKLVGVPQLPWKPEVKVGAWFQIMATLWWEVDVDNQEFFENPLYESYGCCPYSADGTPMVI